MRVYPGSATQGAKLVVLVVDIACGILLAWLVICLVTASCSAICSAWSERQPSAMSGWQQWIFSLVTIGGLYGWMLSLELSPDLGLFDDIEITWSRDAFPQIRHQEDWETRGYRLKGENAAA